MSKKKGINKDIVRVAFLCWRVLGMIYVQAVLFKTNSLPLTKRGRERKVGYIIAMLLGKN
jgi:hypothetical protein